MADDNRRGWLKDPSSGAPLPPRAQPGYYPGFHTLDQASFWDEATRKVVLARVHEVPPVRFFSEAEARTMAAIAERILPQDDRDDAHRIPIVPFIDERLHSGRGAGYRFEDMLPDPDAYRLGIAAVDEIAVHLHGAAFAELGVSDQDAVLKTLHDGRPPAARATWERMSVTRFFLLLVGDVIDVYYAHPFAWDEVGFGGPSYPRGYIRLENGLPEPWEVEEQRYEWEPPEGSKIVFEPVGSSAESNAPGQGGSH